MQVELSASIFSGVRLFRAQVTGGAPVEWRRRSSEILPRILAALLMSSSVV